MPRFSHFLVAASLLGATIVACGTKLNPIIECASPATPVTYTNDIKPFTNSYCSCHNANANNKQAAPPRVVFDTYENAAAYAVESRQVVLGGTMPPNSVLDANVRCIVDAWLQGNLTR